MWSSLHTPVQGFILANSVTTKMAARIASIIESLANAGNQVEILEDLKTLLATLPVLSLANVVPNISFNTVFDCLTTDNRYEERRFALSF